MSNVMTLVVLSLMACDQGDRVLYYDNIDSVGVSGFDGDSFEVGNLGGKTVTVTGSGFGSEVDLVTVQFGSVNAEVLEVTDTALTVVTPRGPITGGLVDVRVAAPSGQGELVDGYEYQVPSVTDDQAGYVLINDYWRSPSDGSEEAAYAGAWVGFGASAEWYDFAFPRAHASNVGYLGATDWTGDEWVVEYPAYRPFVQAADDLLKEIPNGLTLVNPNVPEGSTCIVLEEEADGSLVYVEGDCGGLDYREYQNGQLQFCEEQSIDAGTRSYQAEWPIEEPFMVPVGEIASDDLTDIMDSCQNGLDDDDDGLADALDPDCHPEVRVEAAGTGFNDDDLMLRFPEQMDFSLGNQEGSFLLDLGGCSSDVEGAVLTIEWQPSGVEYSTHEKIAAADTHVRLTVMQSQFGWFGPIDFPIQATITVPDAYNVDPETGLSSLSLPVDVMNQFASFTNANSLTGCDSFGGCSFGDADGNYGMFWVAATRVTEYRLSAPDHPFNTGGDLVVAYATGTFGLTTNDFTPHIENSGCGNCVDDDGDGWADELDADCILGDSGEEDGLNDVYGCSDGIDNDGNGLIDAEDTENCESGVDGETNCANGVDDDLDGWVDELDSECVSGDSNAAELGADADLACTNGLDDDGDGWIDSADPGCENGAGTDEGGFGTTACNDGIDNDGHYDVDSEDYYCVLYGASSDSEAPASDDYASDCVDGVDSESESQLDDYIDTFDPACEKSPYFSEGTRAWKSTDPMNSECYDDLDNDGDGATDSEDPGCWNPDFDFEPDGFLQDEARDWGTDCSDGVDNDADGWVDGLDPDCQPRDPSAQAELGFGSTQCNDGVDNDGDAAIDAADSDCSSALDDSE